MSEALIVGIVIGLFFGALVRPSLDAWLLKRRTAELESSEPG
jgi:hypothetical protein